MSKQPEGYPSGPAPKAGAPPRPPLFVGPAVVRCAACGADLSGADTELAALKDTVSALTVQRDSALRAQLKAETHNGALRAHQDELRNWLANIIAQWEAAEIDERDDTADAIHRRAIEILSIADGFRR